MKKIVLLVMFIVCFHLASSQSTPKKHYKVDLKTKFTSKKDLNPLKKGLKEQIERSEYFENKEFGEDFSLWILAPDVTREVLSDGSKKIVYECLMEIRTAAAFGKGDFLASRKVRIEYLIDSIELAKIRDPNYVNYGEFILNIIENSTKKLDEATSKGLLGIAAASTPQGIGVKLSIMAINKACTEMRNSFNVKDPLDYKVEFFIIGRGMYNEFEQLVVELENRH